MDTKKFEENIEKTVKADTLYEGRIVNLRIETVELPNKKYAKREIVDHPRGVGVIAMTERGTMFMVKQFRIAVRETLLEIPAGLVEPNEDPKIAAERELREEIGYRATKLEYLFDAYASPGFTNEKLSLFYAEGLVKDPLPMDDTEFIEVFEYAVEELYDMVMNCEISDAKSIIAIQYAYHQWKNQSL